MRKDKRSILKDTKIVTFTGESFVIDDFQNLTTESLGPKAFGLLTLPNEWYPAFFLVPHQNIELLDKEAVISGFSMLHETIGDSDEIIIRSNNKSESIENRGSYDSYTTSFEHLSSTITEICSKTDSSISSSSWIVQKHIKTVMAGHLSNERRLSRDKRDWFYELETKNNGSVTECKSQGRINIRYWRDNTYPDTSTLKCEYAAKFDNVLLQVAKWAYSFGERLHFEWVWNGQEIYVVQVDNASKNQDGVDPKSLVKCPTNRFNIGDLKVFRKVDLQDLNKYSKLLNTKIYTQIGYDMVDFYIWDDHQAIRDLISTKEISNALASDLQILTSRALVIRTDGDLIPTNLRTMLPRSDELRSPKQAINWFTDSFAEKVREVNIDSANFCLIAHHFIPATSSAWCLALPNNRRVRIESLWGIPEGLYWYAHDVFDVDTVSLELEDTLTPSAPLKIKARTRYKDKFIAPNEDGEWVLHNTDEKSDWHSSISDWNQEKFSSEWVSEIAWNSRRIAQTVGKPIVIMWFIDLPSEISNHNVIPWYHTDWDNKDLLIKKASPSTKHLDAKEYVIRSESDWFKIENREVNVSSYSRIIVDPTEPSLVRNQRFAEILANFAKEHSLVVELSGGILSHAFYMLTQRGANVECKDLYATEDEELEFNKLVRDLIPDNILAGGEDVEVVKLEGGALIEALKRKVVEESFEVLDAETTTDLVEEIADLTEVVSKLLKVLKVGEKEINEIRKEKNDKRGAFDKGLMLGRTKLTPSVKDTLKNSTSIHDRDTGAKRTINQPQHLPSFPIKVHVDKRFRKEKEIKQVTVSSPIFLREKDIHDTNLSLKTLKGENLDVELKIESTRIGSDFKIKLELINAPKQLKLDI